MLKQLFGSEVDLQKNSPLNVEQDGKAGKPMEQLFGSQVPASRRAIELQELDHNTGNPMQKFGSEAPISTTPMHGWESYPGTPMSERARKQSK